MNQDDLDKLRLTEVETFRNELADLLEKHNTTIIVHVGRDEPPELSFDTPNTTGNEIKTQYSNDIGGRQQEVTPDLIKQK